MSGRPSHSRFLGATRMQRNTRGGGVHYPSINKSRFFARRKRMLFAALCAGIALFILYGSLTRAPQDKQSVGASEHESKRDEPQTHAKKPSHANGKEKGDSIRNLVEEESDGQGNDLVGDNDDGGGGGDNWIPAPGGNGNRGEGSGEESFDGPDGGGGDGSFGSDDGNGRQLPVENVENEGNDADSNEFDTEASADDAEDKGAPDDSGAQGGEGEDEDVRNDAGAGGDDNMDEGVVDEEVAGGKGDITSDEADDTPNADDDKAENFDDGRDRAGAVIPGDSQSGAEGDEATEGSANGVPDDTADTVEDGSTDTDDGNAAVDSSDDDNAGAEDDEAQPGAADAEDNAAQPGAAEDNVAGPGGVGANEDETEPDGAVANDDETEAEDPGTGDEETATESEKKDKMRGNSGTSAGEERPVEFDANGNPVEGGDNGEDNTGGVPSIDDAAVLTGGGTGDDAGDDAGDDSAGTDEGDEGDSATDIGDGNTPANNNGGVTPPDDDDTDGTPNKSTEDGSVEPEKEEDGSKVAEDGVVNSGGTESGAGAPKVISGSQQGENENASAPDGETVDPVDDGDDANSVEDTDNNDDDTGNTNGNTSNDDGGAGNTNAGAGNTDDDNGNANSGTNGIDADNDNANSGTGNTNSNTNSGDGGADAGEGEELEEAKDDENVDGEDSSVEGPGDERDSKGGNGAEDDNPPDDGTGGAANPPADNKQNSGLPSGTGGQQVPVAGNGTPAKVSVDGGNGAPGGVNADSVSGDLAAQSDANGQTEVDANAGDSVARRDEEEGNAVSPDTPDGGAVGGTAATRTYPHTCRVHFPGTDNDYTNDFGFTELQDYTADRTLDSCSARGALDAGGVWTTHCKVPCASATLDREGTDCNTKEFSWEGTKCKLRDLASFNNAGTLTKDINRRMIVFVGDVTLRGLVERLTESLGLPLPNRGAPHYAATMRPKPRAADEVQGPSSVGVYYRNWSPGKVPAKDASVTWADFLATYFDEEFPAVLSPFAASDGSTDGRGTSLKSLADNFVLIVGGLSMDADAANDVRQWLCARTNTKLQGIAVQTLVVGPRLSIKEKIDVLHENAYGAQGIARCSGMIVSAPPAARPKPVVNASTSKPQPPQVPNAASDKKTTAQDKVVRQPVAPKTPRAPSGAAVVNKQPPVPPARKNNPADVRSRRNAPDGGDSFIARGLKAFDNEDDMDMVPPPVAKAPKIRGSFWLRLPVEKCPQQLVPDGGASGQSAGDACAANPVLGWLDYLDVFTMTGPMWPFAESRDGCLCHYHWIENNLKPGRRVVGSINDGIANVVFNYIANERRAPPAAPKLQ